MAEVATYDLQVSTYECWADNLSSYLSPDAIPDYIEQNSKLLGFQRDVAEERSASIVVPFLKIRRMKVLLWG